MKATPALTNRCRRRGRNLLRTCAHSEYAIIWYGRQDSNLQQIPAVSAYVVSLRYETNLDKALATYVYHFHHDHI